MGFFPEQRFDDIEVIWEQVLADCPTDSIFITPWWQGTWWRRFGTNERISIEPVYSDEGLLGISPLMTSGGVTTFIGDKNVYAYMDFPGLLYTSHAGDEGFGGRLCDSRRRTTQPPVRY